MRQCSQAKKQAGFSLLEVLLAATVMSSGLAGLAALHMAALGGTLEATYRGQALLLAKSIAGMVQVAPSGAASYISPGGPSSCPVNTVCTPDQFASGAVAAWRDDIATRLPAGAGLLCRDSSPWDGTALEPGCDGAGPMVVKIFWTSSTANHAVHHRVVQVVP